MFAYVTRSAPLSSSAGNQFFRQTVTPSWQGQRCQTQRRTLGVRVCQWCGTIGGWTRGPASNTGHRRCSVEERSDAVRLHARPRRSDDDYVEIDGEDRGSSRASRNLGIIPSLAKPVLLAANSLGNKLTDLALDFAPNTVDRSTVEIAVKAALVLLAVALARSLLGVALTLGTVLFGIYVATKLWTKQELPGQSPDRPAKRGRSQRQRPADDDGLSDVWFESKSKQKRQKPPSDNTFW